MRALRQFFFYVFVAVYLVAAPVAILYAFGYMWAPGAERGLVRSGLVSLSSTPDDAQIFLCASRYTRRTPAVLRGLLPGDYALRLSKPGHEDLVVAARIEPDRAVLLDRLILLPAQRAPRPASDQPWSDFWSTAGGRYLILRRGSAFFRFDTRNPDDPPPDVSRLFSEQPDEIVWDRRNEDELYVRVGARVHRLALDDGAIYPDIAPPARRIAMYRGRLHIPDDEGRPARIARNGAAEPASKRIPPDWFARGAAAPTPDAAEAQWLYCEANRVAVLMRTEADDDAWTWSERVLHTHATPVARAQWAHDDSHVIFSAGGMVWLLALERGGGGPPRPICAIGPGGAFHFDERSGRVWLLDSESRLASLALTPPRALLPLPRDREDAP
jgi:hypothetical protein